MLLRLLKVFLFFEYNPGILFHFTSWTEHVLLQRRTMAAVYTQGVDMYILELEESCTVINPYIAILTANWFFFKSSPLAFFALPLSW